MKRKPTFLVIGVPRAGSTWIYERLKEHPNIWVPLKRREVHFFDRDRNYSRGWKWYSRFFPDEDDDFEAVGEVSPHYLFGCEVPGRVKSLGSVNKFVVFLRDPISRLVSHYRFRRMVDGYSGELHEFISDYPDSVEWGRYGRYLKRWYSEFESDRFLVKSIESVAKNEIAVLEAIALHLGVPAGGFRENVGEKGKHQSGRLQRPGLYRIGVRLGKALRRAGLNKAYDAVRKSWIGAILREKEQRERHGEEINLTRDLRVQLTDMYTETSSGCRSIRMST